MIKCMTRHLLKYVHHKLGFFIQGLRILTLLNLMMAVHDSAFVEVCASQIRDFYSGTPYTNFIEFNDGCSTQCTCKKAFYLFSQRKEKATRMYFESSHGKNKSDSLGEGGKILCKQGCLQ